VQSTENFADQPVGMGIDFFSDYSLDTISPVPYFRGHSEAAYSTPLPAPVTITLVSYWIIVRPVRAGSEPTKWRECDVLYEKIFTELWCCR